MFWRVGLRIIAWIIFVAMLLATLIGAVAMISDGNPLGGIAVLLGGCLVSFLSVAMLMIFLNMAKDLSEIRQVICAPQPYISNPGVGMVPPPASVQVYPQMPAQQPPPIHVHTSIPVQPPPPMQQQQPMQMHQPAVQPPPPPVYQPQPQPEAADQPQDTSD